MREASPTPTGTTGLPTALAVVWRRKNTILAAIAIVAIGTHLLLRFPFHTGSSASNTPLLIALVLGGLPLVYELLRKLWHREFGSDLLGGVSIVTAVVMGEYLAGAIIVLMLAGGEALESYALRMPSVAQRKSDSAINDVALADVAVGDTLVVYPHDICPVDGTVIEGNGVMNEAFLTGEPFEIPKAPGSNVISGAVNGETALTITATLFALDSHYGKIMAWRSCASRNRIVPISAGSAISWAPSMPPSPWPSPSSSGC